MKAVILATGENQKLAPLTDKFPSPLLPIVGKPIIFHTIEMLARANVVEIIICTHNKGGNIESYIGSGRRWGISIHYSHHGAPLGDAGAIRWAKGYLNEPFFVLDGSEFIDLNVQHIYAAHTSSQAICTRLVELQDQSPLNVTVFNPEIFAYIPSREKYDIHSQLLPALERDNRQINIVEHIGYRNSISTFSEYYKVQKDFMNGVDESFALNTVSIGGNRFGSKVWVGKNNLIHPSVRIYPPVIIGDNCQIGRDVDLGPNTVISSNCILDDEATARESIITERSYIGKLINVEQKIVTRSLTIDIPSGESTKITDPFLLSTATPALGYKRLRFSLEKLFVFFLLILLSPLIVLTGLFSFLGTGRVFKKVERIGVKPSKLIFEQINHPSRYFLRHFNTSHKNSFSALLTNWIKYTELYRLPELFDVLNGNISLIGVKPLSITELGAIQEEWQHLRFTFSAGFTGLWYIEQRNLADINSFIIHDVYYATTRNIFEDLRIILKTAPRWIKKVLFF